MGDLIQRRKATADEMMRGAICEAATAVRNLPDSIAVADGIRQALKQLSKG